MQIFGCFSILFSTMGYTLIPKPSPPCRGTPLPSLKVEALSVSGALVALDAPRNQHIVSSERLLGVRGFV